MLCLRSAVLCLGYVEHCRWCGLAHWALLDGVSRYCDIQRNLLHRCYQALSPAAWQQARSHNLVLRMQRTQRRCTIADAGLLLRSCQSNLSPTPHLLFPFPPKYGVHPLPPYIFFYPLLQYHLFLITISFLQTLVILTSSLVWSF